MYFRIIVKHNGAFLFRTSKIKTAALALEIHKNLDVGFNGLAGQTGEDEQHVVEILEVTGEPTGNILDANQLAILKAQTEAEQTAINNG